MSCCCWGRVLLRGGWTYRLLLLLLSGRKGALSERIMGEPVRIASGACCARRGLMSFLPCCCCCLGMLPSAEDMVPAARGAPKLGLACAGRALPAEGGGAGTVTCRLAGILGY